MEAKEKSNFQFLTSSSSLLTDEVSLTVVGTPTVDEWVSTVEKMKHWKDSTFAWYLGDLLNYGEAHYGEMASQVMDATSRAYSTLRRYADTAQRVHPTRRKLTLSFSHHWVIKDLPPEEQTKALDEAEFNGWSYEELRHRLQSRLLPPVEKTWSSVCAVGLKSLHKRLSEFVMDGADAGELSAVLVKLEQMIEIMEE